MKYTGLKSMIYAGLTSEDPRVLLLLTPYALSRTNTVVAAIERSTDGVLRFQLGGDDGGDWIEWHRGEGLPEDFTGGLERRPQATEICTHSQRLVFGALRRTDHRIFLTRSADQLA